MDQVCTRKCLVSHSCIGSNQLRGPLFLITKNGQTCVVVPLLEVPKVTMLLLKSDGTEIYLIPEIPLHSQDIFFHLVRMILLALS